MIRGMADPRLSPDMRRVLRSATGGVVVANGNTVWALAVRGLVARCPHTGATVLTVAGEVAAALLRAAPYAPEAPLAGLIAGRVTTRTSVAVPSGAV